MLNHLFTTIAKTRCSCRSLRNLIFVVSSLTAFYPLMARGDWQTFQHDQARSGATSESLPRQLTAAWVYQPGTQPRPAWDEPAIWDGWSKTHNLTNRQVFDKAFHVAAVGDDLFFGSSVDDQVHCLNAATGQERWSFFAEGPVRLTPCVVNGRVYFGSDDGFVYCLQADTGELNWKHRPAPTPRRIPGNGRVISAWPIRTGVVVVGDRVYCGAGVIPSDGVYVCALDAETGDSIWTTRMNDLPAQGYLLASATRVYVVTSRDRPVVFEAATGKRLHQVGGGTGGTYALLTGDTLFYGPNKTGDVSMIGAKQDVLASFAGNHLIVAKPLSFLHSSDKLSGLDRETYVRLYGERKQVAAQRSQLAKELKSADDEQAKQLRERVDELEEQIKQLTEDIGGCLKWTTDCACPFALILAGDALIAGGDGRVLAVDAASGETRWEKAIVGKAMGLAVNQGRLFVSTDQGTIHCYVDASDADLLDSAHAVADRQEPPVRLQAYQGPFVTKQAPPRELLGPFAEFIAPGQVRIRWETTTPSSSQLEFGVDLNQNPRRWTDDTQRTQHEFVVDKVYRDVMYQYRVGGTLDDGETLLTEPYRFDAHFDYLPVQITPRPSPYEQHDLDAQYADLAKRMLDEADVRRGYALVVGSSQGQLAYHLAVNSDLNIVVVESDPQAVAEIRRRLQQAGLYGSRISVHQRDLTHLPYGPFLANLVVSERMLTTGQFPVPLDVVLPCLRPAGGTLVLGSWKSSESFTAPTTDVPGQWHERKWDDHAFWVLQREKLPGSGDWSHQYASPDNSACSHDELVRGEMTVQWWGKPGARPMPDRGNRNPPPVSANGRLFVQGNRTLFGMDAYNGTILWAKQIPNMRRANMPRDASNMVAEGELLWVSMGSSCVAFDGQTGERKFNRNVPEFDEATMNRDYDWGYIARVDETIVGSGVRRDSHYRGDLGEWYQNAEQGHVARVTSDFLFAGAWYGGTPRWVYQQGVILNSTLTIADGKVFFIESRNPDAKRSASGRMLGEILQDQYLIAVDLESGDVLWEQPYDFSQCHFVTYMTHQHETLLVTGTDHDRNFHTYAFDATDGSERWQHHVPDKKGHHTGQLAHPTIVGKRVYFNKHAYDLLTGEVLNVHDFNWHGCGVMSASNHTIFSRYEYHGMYDLATKQRTELLGIRSGCWLSLIPSGGLLLAPETSAGCSCGHSLQTSIAYIPAALVPEVPVE